MSSQKTGNKCYGLVFRASSHILFLKFSCSDSTCLRLDRVHQELQGKDNPLHLRQVIVGWPIEQTAQPVIVVVNPRHPTAIAARAGGVELFTPHRERKQEVISISTRNTSDISTDQDIEDEQFERARPQNWRETPIMNEVGPRL